MTNVLGRPITGEITRPRVNRKEQWSADKFIELLDSVLSIENVDSVRWTQYTPYFNDGDACIFGINEPALKLVTGNDEDGDYGDGYVDSYGMQDYSNGVSQNPVPKPEYEAIYVAFKQFSDSLEHFEDLFEETFGDHAKVTAKITGFDVEFYEHD